MFLKRLLRLLVPMCLFKRFSIKDAIRIVAFLTIGFFIATFTSTKLKLTCRKHKPNNLIFYSKFDLTFKNLAEHEKLLFIGVSTADKFLNTRCKALYDSWGKHINGKLVFFASQNSTRVKDLPVVYLPNVDDTYPPQKKVFKMLRFMQANYGEKFEWFIRADDDVFIRPEKMERFLRSLNSSKLYFIGQYGQGQQGKKGKLSLNTDENYCMGGPSMVFSRATLRKLAPNLQKCIKSLYSSHEDVEVGRCVSDFVGIKCPWSIEVSK